MFHLVSRNESPLPCEFRKTRGLCFTLFHFSRFLECMSPYGGEEYITRSRNGGPTAPAAPSVHSNSSSIEPFPTLTDSQHKRLDRIINALDRDATSWAEFKQKKEELEGGIHSEEDEDENDIFPISLKLVFQQGVTWKDKWKGVQQNQDQTERRNNETTVGLSHSRKKSGRESDGLDVLRARMDRVKLYDSDVTPKGTPSSPTQHRDSMPPAPRPRSTPAALHSQPSTSSRRPPATMNSTRSFLVRKTEPGYSSSDDYAGVPSLQDLALARRRRRESEAAESAPPLHSTPARPVREVSSIQAEQIPISAVFRDPLPPSHPPAHSTPPPKSKHPLLEKRLAELGLGTPSPTAPPTQTPTPISFEAPRQSYPSRLRPSDTPTTPHLTHLDISSLDAEADRFRRLHLISSHFDAWRTLTSFQLSRTQAVDHARDTWVARCAVQDWAGKTAKIALLKEREKEWISTREQRERRMEKGAKGKVWMKWTEVFLKRQETRREEEQKERKEMREAELRKAKGEVARRRNEGLARRAIEVCLCFTLTSTSSTDRSDFAALETRYASFARLSIPTPLLASRTLTTMEASSRAQAISC